MARRHHRRRGTRQLFASGHGVVIMQRQANAGVLLAQTGPSDFALLMKRAHNPFRAMRLARNLMLRNRSGRHWLPAGFRYGSPSAPTAAGCGDDGCADQADFALLMKRAHNPFRAMRLARNLMLRINQPVNLYHLRPLGQRRVKEQNLVFTLMARRHHRRRGTRQLF
jgi:hypothetical protein